MAFNDIFNFARSTSTAGNTAQKELFGFLPKQENESISTPPHDPFNPEEVTQQDPKIIRETSPQSNIIFNFIESITSDIKISGDQVEQTMNEPSSTVSPAGGVMGKARETTDKVKDDTPTPVNESLNPPQPKVGKPEGWNNKPVAQKP